MMFGFSPQMMGGLIYEEIQSLPPMTGDVAPVGHIATASSFYAPTPGYPAFRAFDGIRTSESQWITGMGSPNASWVARQTPLAIKVWKYRVGAANTIAGRSPRDFRLQGSNDGTTWVDIDVRTGQAGWSTTVFETREYRITGSPVPYSRHRLFINANNGDASFTVVGELELLQVLTS